MYRITANAASTHTRKRRRQRTEALDDQIDPIEEHIEALPGPAAESAEALDRVSQAIATLPVKLRHVVLLKDVYGLSHEDIAAELDISVAAAKVRLHRARRKLKDMLYEQGDEAHAV
jgi:RNA polymerase sigma-70 factor (ECF subfamily)